VDELRIEYQPLDGIARASRNPKDHDLGAIGESIKRRGYVAPVLVNEATGRLVAGHGRLDALLQLRAAGLEPPARIKVDAAGNWLVPVIRGIAFKSDADAAAYLVADNRLVELGGWRDDELAGLLKDLNDGPGLEGTGYDKDDLDALLRTLATPSPTADDVGEPEKAITRPGDLWVLGEHRLLCGDSTKAEDVDRLLGGRKVGVAICDPPYGIQLDKYSPHRPDSVLAPTYKARVYRPIIGDDHPFDAGAVRGIPSGAEAFWFGADYYSRSLGNTESAGSWLVWDKRKETQDEGFGNGFELIWSAQRHKRMLLRHEWFGFCGANPSEAQGRVHPTQKPTALLVDILRRWSEGAVYDPFAGSGSVLIAAGTLRRPCYSVEIDPYYCDVILERWRKKTGNEPELETA